MENSIRKGIIIDRSSLSGNGGLDYDDLFNKLSNTSGVHKVWNFEMPVKTIVKKLTGEIIQARISRLIIIGKTPGFIRGYFEPLMVSLGNKKEDIQLVSFQEYGLTRKEDAEMAEALVFCAVHGIAPEIAATQTDNEAKSDTLVIGGGIAGIQAALEIAEADINVYLLEKTGTIGGKMALFDKTFPTLDCAACILTPKMVEVNQHPNIHLMTYCEIENVKGIPGNYEVTIRKKARRVNLATCIGCGTCSEKCPATAPSEFDVGTTLRKAIYIPFPQAVPNKYLIDETACIYLKNGKCRACVKACPVPDCIDLDEKDETIVIPVGNIVVATGFKPFDASRMPQFGYGKLSNVVTSLEFERLLNASGPTGGYIHFRSQDKKGNWIFNTDSAKPRSLAIIHCIGSRDENYNKYCSRVCCMYSLKFAHLVKEKLPEADVHEFYIDMRAFGKGYEEFYERIKHEGVRIIRGKTAKIEEKGGKLILRGENIDEGRLIELETEMVVLAIGLEPAEETEKLAGLLGIRRSDDGWFMEINSNTDPTGTSMGGIYIAGVCQGPKDIPDCVAQGSAAASRVIQNVIRGKLGAGFGNITPESIIEKVKESTLIS